MARSKPRGEFDTLLGLKIKALRGYTGVSGQWLGERLGVSTQQIMKYESGENRISSSQLNSIARIFNKPLSYFYEGNEGNELECIASLNPIQLKILYNVGKLKNVNHQQAVSNLVKTLLKEG